MQQQLPPAATAAPQQLGQQNHPCYPAQNSYPNAAQQLGAQYGPNQVYPGYQSGMGGMPGGSGIPGLGGTPGMGGGGFPGMGGGLPGMGGGMGGMSGIVGMIAGQALNSHNNAVPPNANGNGYYGGYGPQTGNPQYGNGYSGPQANNPQYGNGSYGGYGPQANNAAPNSQIPCPPR
ncbi:MAG TPA: hypothetical protein VKB71_13075 [Rhizomicrobium sp.]|nr:hypothetical protein [Rhizomicrobium sp.]